MLVKNILVSVIALTTIACVTPTYSGAKLKREEVALLSSSDLHITILDDCKPVFTWDTWEVLPGVHSVTAYLSNYQKRAYNSISVNFLLEAGHRYNIEPIYPTFDSWTIQVVDQDTRKVVSFTPRVNKQ